MKKNKKQERKIRAQERLEVKRTPQEQLKRLDNMFGKDQGAKKEREKLLKRIEELNGNKNIKSEN